MYVVKEIFYTLQGEGARAGTPAVFLRFTGCNLWSGREEDRASAVCQFCDTDFVGTNGTGGGRFETPEDLADAVEERGPACASRYVVCTGGEPLLQLDDELIRALHARGYQVAVETNGTIEVPRGVDWICVSPKAGSKIVQRSGDELKLVYPQSDIAPEDVSDWSFDHFFLQPMDGPLRKKNTKSAVAWCLQHPRWRLSVQTHKMIGLR